MVAFMMGVFPVKKHRSSINLVMKMIHTICLEDNDNVLRLGPQLSPTSKVELGATVPRPCPDTSGHPLYRDQM